MHNVSSHLFVRFCFSLREIFIATEFHPRLMQLHNQSLRSIDPIVFTLQFILIHCNLATKLLNIFLIISERWSFSLSLPPFCISTQYIILFCLTIYHSHCMTRQMYFIVNFLLIKTLSRKNQEHRFYFY